MTPEDRLEKLLAHWDDVEGSIKKAELFQGQVTVPAINELRYAGRQIIKAVHMRSQPEDERYLRALTNAEQYVINADHDIVDGVVVFLSKRVSDLNYRFGKSKIASYVPSYNTFCDKIDECKNKIENSRRSDSDERKRAYKEMKENYMALLIQGYADVVNGEAVVAAEIDGYLYDIDKLRYNNKVLLSFTVILSLIMVASIVMRFVF